MTAAILGSVLLALLAAWGMAFRHDARTSRRADPIGDIFDAWLHSDDSATPLHQGDPPLSHLNATKFARPFVYATSADLIRLRSYVRARPRGGPGVELLIEEIARMEDAPTALSETFVRLGAPVRYKDLRTKRERLVRVVAPEAADPEENRVSVVSPIGAALIGLRPGSIFRWLEPDGSPRAIKVVEVET